jgi:chromosome segregation protein
LRLTDIKLAGFKSFVDPTRIPVPGQLVGIVGPNGCGKSNIIDAVRWVLGESSARHLRGETMQDVLFNGAGGRQPVNRASVELVFDNSLGRAGGQWSGYGEIAVKRVLEREGESSYYINNLHVRRRDVADIFLGTGLGARAYAIIEQGMISRIIEAKPEELRVFLEEAAGVSKYRERRRETELRLADTRENLTRVEDIRQELEKQLEHLQGQAEVAQRYQELKAQLVNAQQLLWLARKQEAGAAREKHAREIERLVTELEAETARLREAERRAEEMRGRHFETAEQVHVAQGALYEVNAEMARLEQQIQHVRENRTRVENQLVTSRVQQAQYEEERTHLAVHLAEWRERGAAADQACAEAETHAQAQSARLPISVESLRAAQLARDDAQRGLAQTEQAREVEQTRRAHAADLAAQFEARATRLTEEQLALAMPDPETVSRLTGDAQTAAAGLEDRRGALERAEAGLPGLEQRLREAQTAVEAAGARLAALEARAAALKALQDRIAGSEQLHAWLAARGLDGKTRLFEQIEIEAGWEDALEAVLRERLNAIALDSLGAASAWMGEPPPARTTMYAVGPGAVPAAGGSWNGCAPLASLIRVQVPALKAVVEEWLHGVYAAQDAAGAAGACARLPTGALLVTREGHVFSPTSVSFHAPDSELHGVFARRRELEQLGTDVQAATEARERVRAAVTAAEQALGDGRAAIEALRADVAGLQERHHALQLDALRVSEQASRTGERHQQITQELAELAEQRAQALAQAAAADQSLQGLAAQATQHAAAVAAAESRRTAAEQALAAQQEAASSAERDLQQAVFQRQTCRSKIEEGEQTEKRLAAAHAQVLAAIEAQTADLAGLDEAPWQAQLAEALTRRTAREQTLAAARDAAAADEATLHEIEQSRLAIEQGLEPIRTRTNDMRLKEQEARLTEEQFAQELTAAGADEAALAEQLAGGKRASSLQGDITRLNNEISALGLVNLAALEELTQATERKSYLDAQSLDLTQALTTLEDAIRRIDRETRERLQSTFDEVNRHFGAMFPSLFGGGQAKLLLTGDEILDAGVQVIAQPPGKKNSSIHLLSGGEKALTALSLVFAIFQLNPAPFCLLDEVDAPLDDTNTERFCKLVEKMAEHSQFLFISHNKITMEIAEQLIGVTMQEAGISRVVAVDIEEAMKLADEAA